MTQNGQASRIVVKFYTYLTSGPSEKLWYIAAIVVFQINTKSVGDIMHQLIACKEKYTATKYNNDEEITNGINLQ